MDELKVDRLAKALADSRYLSLTPPMNNAFDRLSPVTQDVYRKQARILIEDGWVQV